MKVMVMIKATPSSEAGELPSNELLTAMANFNEQLLKAGILLAGEGLKPSSEGARVHFSGRDRTVTDGPFTETKELIAGFWIWRVGSLEEAVDWVKRCPNPMPEEVSIEIRPIFESEDFGDEFTPELREQEAGQRAVHCGLERPRFLDQPALRIAGRKVRYQLETRDGIPSQWQQFATHIGNIPGQQGAESYGVCWNMSEDCSFDYLTGVAITSSAEPPSEFASIELEPRRYAVFPHSGHISSLPRTIERIWRDWAPECGLKIAGAPCFERYTAQFDAATGVGGVELWIPLETS